MKKIMVLTLAAIIGIADITNIIPIGEVLAEEITVQPEENANLEQEKIEDETALENQVYNIAQPEENTIANVVQEYNVQAKAAEDFFIFNESTQTITGYSQAVDAPRDIVIPRVINNVEVLHIGDNAFSGQQLTSVTLNDNLQTIGAFAFGNNTIQNIVIPNSVTSIGDNAFQNCTNLAVANIGDGMIRIGNSVFSGCSRLTTITIPNSVTSIGTSAFQNCSSLTSITIPESVTNIEASAFSGCSRLTTITIPNSVTSIGTGAFQNCSSLTSITLSEGITTIKRGTFAGCGSLTTITIPNSVTSIDNGNLYQDGAFYNCTKLTTVNLGEGITSIGTGAFQNCSSLTSITIPNSVASIFEGAFSGCSRLTEVTIPNNVTSIGVSAFEYCTNLATVNLGEGITSIENYVFRGCRSLTEVTIGDSVTSIGVRAFDSCRSLTEVTIGDSVTSIGTGAFSGCANLREIHIPTKEEGSISGAPWESNAVVYWKDTIKTDQFVYSAATKTIQKYIGVDAAVEVPAYIEYNGQNYPVEKIGNGAFSGCSSLTEVTIPNSVTSLGDNNAIFINGVFQGCTNLTTVNLEEGVTSIGRNAFSGCSSLTSITIPNSVTSIGTSAFQNCSSLTSITIPESVTSIGGSAFLGCSSLTAVTILEGVTNIEYSAFQNCSSLTSITIPDSVTSIGNATFDGCTNLREIHIPTKEEGSISGAPWDSNAAVYWKGTIKVDPFIYNTETKTIQSYIGTEQNATVVIPAYIEHEGKQYPVENIAPNLFNSNNNVATVDIQANITTIPYSTFSGCSNLISITIPDSVTSIEMAAFQNCRSLTSIIIPEGVTSIEYGTFQNCSSLTSITIPDSVTSIERVAFQNCSSLTSITIPDGVTSIGSSNDYYNGVFQGCTNLTTVNLGKGLTNIGDSVFSGCRSLTSITIPEGVTSIGNGAFVNCSSLTEVTLPDSVTNLGDDNAIIISNGVFQGCTNLTTVNLGDGVTEIASRAFFGCSSLTEAKIGNHINSINATSFGDCPNLETIIIMVARDIAPVTVTSQQPWGAPQTTNVYYADALVSFEHTVTPVTAEYARDINILASINGAISTVTLPDGTAIHVGTNLWPQSGTYKYPVTSNGEYIFKGMAASGVEIEYKVIIDDIGKPTVTANNATIFVDEAATITEEQLLQLVSAKATTVEKGEDFTGGIIELASGDLEKVRALTLHGQTATIAVKATSPTGLTSTVSVEIKALQMRNLTFDMNGGIGAIQPQQVLVGELTQQPQQPSKVGYTFSGWYKEADYQTMWDFNVDTMPDEDVTLYAKWEANTYNVAFSANGGTGAMANQAFIYDTAQELTANMFTREGYTFAGWSTAPDGPVAYTDGASVQNLTADNNGTVVLYAVWEVHTYSVTFDVNGGIGAMTDQAFVYDVAQALTANAFTREGYTFKGWSTTQDGSVEYTDAETVQNLTVDNNAVITLYAVWEAHTYNVTFDVNGGTGAMANQAFIYDDVAQALTANAFTREGYTFKGWSTTQDGPVEYTDAETVQNLTADNNAVITLYAVWETHTYNVTFDVNGGTGAMTDQAFVYDTVQVLTANAFTRENYTFAGWSTTPDGPVEYTDGASVQNLTADNNGTVTLYAVWEAYTYNVAFDANGGTGVMANQAFAYNTAQALIVNSFTKEGYTFKGWSTTPDGPVEYTDAETVQNLTADNNAVITLYAVWEANVLSGSIRTGDGTMQIGIGASILAVVSAGVMLITRRKKNQENE